MRLKIVDFRFQIWVHFSLDPIFNLLSSISNLNEHSFRFFMRRVLAAEAAELAEFQPLGRLLLVLRRAVVAPLTVHARQRDDVSHDLNLAGSRLWASGARPVCPASMIRTMPGARSLESEAYSTISVIVPEPTVRPPSRMANRAPFSSATGVSSSPVMDVLSPGITISTPSGSLSVPVTSVVRM